MDGFTYSWRDFATCFRVALNLQRVVVSTKYVFVTLIFIWLATGAQSVELPFEMPRPSFGPLTGTTEFFYLAGLGLVWWWISSHLWIAISRGVVVEFCADQQSNFKSLRRYSWAYGRYHFRAPFAIALFTLPFWLPVYGWSFFEGIPAIGGTLAAITSPIAFVLAVIAGLIFVVGVIALPMQAASVALHGGDSYEGISRSVMYTTMAPQRYILWFGIKLVMLALACVAALCVYTLGAAMISLTYGIANDMSAMPELFDVMLMQRPADSVQHLSPAYAQEITFGAWFFGLFALGYIISFDAACDVLILMLMRHWCDGTPATEYFSPSDAFSKKATLMEQSTARLNVTDRIKVVEKPSEEAKSL